MSDVIALYRAQFRTTIAEQFQYRGALAIWMLGLVLEPVIYLSVWSAVAAPQLQQLGPELIAEARLED